MGESLKDCLLNVLDIAAKHGTPLVRVWDLTRPAPDQAIRIETLIDSLLTNGTLIEREFSGDRHIGLRAEVELLEKEVQELEFGPRRAAEVMLHREARKAHPSWVRCKDARGFPSWERTDPNAPRTKWALIEWFEINYPAEAKRITKDFTTGNFAD